MSDTEKRDSISVSLFFWMEVSSKYINKMKFSAFKERERETDSTLKGI